MVGWLRISGYAAATECHREECSGREDGEGGEGWGGGGRGRRGVMEDTRVTAPLPDPAILTSPAL